MKLSMFEMTFETLTESCNDAVSVYLTTLKNLNKITPEQFDEFSQYRVIVAKPTFWGRLYSKLNKLDENTAYINVVKVETNV